MTIAQYEGEKRASASLFGIWNLETFINGSGVLIITFSISEIEFILEESISAASTILCVQAHDGQGFFITG